MSPRFAYRFCGLRIESDLALPGLDAAPASDHAADVVVRYGSVPSEGLKDRETGGAWCAEGDTIKLWIRGVATYSIAGGREVWIDPVNGAHERDLVLFLQGSGFGAIWHQRGMLALHASSVSTGETCIAFAGASGAGKSTMAAFLTRRGCSLVSDDVSVLALTDDGPAVWPGPARLKLWEDGLERLGEDVAGLPHAGGRRPKFHLPVTQMDPAGAAPVPLKALYLIEDGEGEPRIEDLSRLDAINVVARHTYCPEYVSALGLESQHFRLCVGVAGRITVRRLVRRRGFDHMDRVLQALDAERQTS